jgi:hypothetical protein
MHGFGLPGITGFVEYGASIASDFDDDWRHFGEVACINASRLTRLRFIKNLMPLGFPREEKKVWVMEM